MTPCLFGSHYLGRNEKTQDNIKAKGYFSNITRLGKYLVKFDLGLGHRKLLKLQPFDLHDNTALSSVLVE